MILGFFVAVYEVLFAVALLMDSFKLLSFKLMNTSLTFLVVNRFQLALSLIILAVSLPAAVWMGNLTAAYATNTIKRKRRRR